MSDIFEKSGKSQDENAISRVIGLGCKPITTNYVQKNMNTVQCALSKESHSVLEKSGNVLCMMEFKDGTNKIACISLGKTPQNEEVNANVISMFENEASKKEVKYSTNEDNIESLVDLCDTFPNSDIVKNAYNSFIGDLAKSEADNNKVMFETATAGTI